MPPTREQRPTSEALTENPAGATRNMITVPDSMRPVRGSSGAGVDLLTLTDRERECHLSGYLSGVLAGIDIGREQMDNEIATLQRRAFGIVQAMAKLAPWEEAQQARRQHQDKAAEHHRAAGQPWPLEVAS